MKLRILAVGRLKEPHARAAAADYLARINRYLPCEVAEVKDGAGAGEPAKVLALEAQRLRQAGGASGAAFRVALDVRGKGYSSTEFARFLGDRMTYGPLDVAFLVGGPDGLDPALRREAELELSLSTLTLPHDLARLLLLEQLYRGLTILRGEPYHR